jgi:hypothetical protein
MPSGKLRIFADCAGLSSELIALAFLGFTSENMEFVGGSEIDGTKRVLAQAVHKSFGLSTEKKALEHDIFDRNFSNTKASDLYISGFPCPAYSNCGQKLGAKDGQKRGLLVFEGLKYIAYWKPSVVILENVVAFLHKKHARTHEVMRKVFFACGYKVYMKSSPQKNTEFLRAGADVTSLPFISRRAGWPSSFPSHGRVLHWCHFWTLTSREPRK